MKRQGPCDENQKVEKLGFSGDTQARLGFPDLQKETQDGELKQVKEKFRDGMKLDSF